MSRPGQRIDKWLWHARMFKTRSLASGFAASGKVRLNGTRVEKASQAVAPGDVLTFAVRGQVRVLRIAALAERRGPFAEARLLYEDLSPAPASAEAAAAPPAPAPPRGSGRPTKRDRRSLDRWRQSAE